MELRKEKSCGCIIIKDNKVLLVYEKNRNFWGFPKGHMEERESEIENIKWCDFNEALNTLTFDNWKEMFKKIINDLDNK